MKSGFKYLIFFFLVCNILTISGFANHRYSTLDYIRGDEYIQKAKTKSKQGYYKLRHYFLARNNFQTFIFNTKEYLVYYSMEVLVKERTQELTYLENCITSRPFILPRKNNNHNSSDKDLYKG